MSSRPQPPITSVQVYTHNMSQEKHYCLNENDHHGLLYLNVWFCLVDYLGKIRRCVLVGDGMPLGVGLKVSKSHTRPGLEIILEPTTSFQIKGERLINYEFSTLAYS